MNTHLNIETNPGDCYVYKTLKGKTVGFIVIQKINQNKNLKGIRFCMVMFQNETVQSLPDFNKGEIFTHKVYVSLDGDFEKGVQCYDFNAKDFPFLDQLKYLGNIPIDPKKFTYGGGGVFTNEDFLQVEMDNFELINSTYVREKVDVITK